MEFLAICLAGQSLSILLAFAAFGASGIDSEYFKFNTLGLLYLGQFLFAQTYIFSGITRKNPFNLKITFICSICDLSGNLCLLYAYKQPINGYIVIFISQLIFPKIIFIKKVVMREKEKINVYRFVAYFVIISISFLINWYSGDSLKFDIYGAILAFISNLCFAGVILLQERVSKSDPIYYIRDYSIIAFISGLLLSLIIEYKEFKNPINFYYKYPIQVAAYSIGITFYYLMSVFFIKIWGPVAYNASVLSYSAYFGLMKLISEQKFSILSILGFTLCIASTLVVVLTGIKSGTKKQ
ncbi:hypothetical protein DMUE_3900 [Dictyocoela muelleri]|nr:hypothetical protein DMUE_3900 [Dictyocoela muelleri]